jgi:hypothetical protein
VAKKIRKKNINSCIKQLWGDTDGGARSDGRGKRMMIKKTSERFWGKRIM